MPKLFDVSCSTGSYTNAQGEEKSTWLKCGMVLANTQSPGFMEEFKALCARHQVRFSIKLEALPVGKPSAEGGGLWLGCFEPRPFQGQAQQPVAAPPPAYPQQAAPAPAGDPDIPF